MHKFDSLQMSFVLALVFLAVLLGDVSIWVALVCILMGGVLLARSGLGLGIASWLLGFFWVGLAWTLLPGLHPIFWFGIFATGSCLRSSALRGVGLCASLMLAGLLWQAPGVSFEIYQRVRPSLTDHYRPAHWLPSLGDSALGPKWLEGAGAHYFFSTPQAWVSDGGRVVQNAELQLIRTALQSSGVVVFMGWVTPDLCREFASEIAQGHLFLFQPKPVGRTPACESVASDGLSSSPESAAWVILDPFERTELASRLGGGSVQFSPESVWTCAGMDAQVGNKNSKADSLRLRFHWINCEVSFRDARARSRITGTPLVQRALEIWGDGA